MGKKSLMSGVQAKGVDRIQFDFEFEGIRYRPTVKRVPSEANLRRACKQLAEIKKRIERGTFKFEEEFPDYRFKHALPVALSTLNGYRKILDRIFRPEIGRDKFEIIVYSRLAEIVADNTKGMKKRTYNNITSAV